MNRNDHATSLLCRLHNGSQAYDLSRLHKEEQERLKRLNAVFVAQKVYTFIIISTVLVILGAAIGALFAYAF